MATVMRETDETAVRDANVSDSDPEDRHDHRERVDDAVSADQIAAEAYASFERRGLEHGNDVDDWLEAERRLRAQAPR